MCACAGRGGGGGSGRSRRSRRRSRRRWPEVAVLGRAMFVVSVAFFVVGILVTVFGFGGGGGVGAGPGGGEVAIGTEFGGSAVLPADSEQRVSRHALPMQVYIARIFCPLEI